jgi:HEAT repeat protein
MQSKRIAISTISNLLQALHAVDTRERDAIIVELQGCSKDIVVEVFNPYLTIPDTDIRADAAEALFRVLGSEAIDILLPLLNDPIAIVRYHICGLLHDFGDQRATPALVEKLSNDPDATVRSVAAYALGEIADDTALPALAYAQEWDTEVDSWGHAVCDTAASAAAEIIARTGNKCG